jgi:DNA replication protein DnaC
MLVRDMARSDCPVCGGTGWRVVDRVGSNERAERVVERKNATRGAAAGAPRFSWAVPCECAGGDRLSRVQARARIPHRYAHCDFENFDTDPFDGLPQSEAWNRSLAQARVIVEAFAKNFPAGAEAGLLLMGPCGVGKTHLAVAALRQLMLRGHRVRFYDYRELLKDIQASYNPDNPTSELGVLEPVLETEVLLLDDLGASKPSPWAVETIAHILNKRYNEKRVTLLTTNYMDEVESGPSPARLPSGQTISAAREETLTDRIGQRVRSRLYEMCRKLEISSADYRREFRQARGI